MTPPSRIVFMGTPAFAVPSLEILHKSHHQVVVVVTAPDKPAGRGLQPNPSAVKVKALELGIPILQPSDLSEKEFLAELSSFDASVFVVVAFRKLPLEVWSMPSLGTFNLHASLLPQFRGAAPIQRAIMSGVTKTGLTTFLIDEKIDTGKIILQEEMDIGQDETAGELHDRMMIKGSSMVLTTVDLLIANDFKPLDQKELAPDNMHLHTAPKIRREDCILIWSRPWKELKNQIRGLSPYPGAFTTLQWSSGEKKSMKVFRVEGENENHGKQAGEIASDGRSFLKIACLDGWLDCKEVQIEGRKRMSVKELLMGFNTSGLHKAY